MDAYTLDTIFLALSACLGYASGVQTTLGLHAIAKSHGWFTQVGDHAAMADDRPVAKPIGQHATCATCRLMQQYAKPHVLLGAW